MGYTHYWRPQRSFTDVEWDMIKNGFNTMTEHTDIVIVGPAGEPGTQVICNEDEIMFNGLDDNSHEAFAIDREMKSDFEFCKTAEKPYDAVVCAMLMLIDHAAPGALNISSDGDMAGDDWAEGREIFNSMQ